jgi:SAM-dependent MidA family methyltransferase
LEVGAGTGRLAVDTLTRLETLGRLPEEYFILEVSADLRERQHDLVRECIPHLLPRVRWLNVPPDDPFDGVILANEVLDALPVARFRWHESECEELGVAVSNGLFMWSARPAGPEMTETCSQLAAAAGGWEGGYVSEYCPRLGAWTRSVVRCLRKGAVLWFDYGLPRPQYYLPERQDGTLICHFRQRAHENPFIHPGLQDISAWVDFTALAEACSAARCELAGFTTQAYFLAGLGIDREMRFLAGENDGRFARLANQAKRLMLPGDMGERFKAMAWTRGVRRELSGFALPTARALRRRCLEVVGQLRDGAHPALVQALRDLGSAMRGNVVGRWLDCRCSIACRADISALRVRVVLHSRPASRIGLAGEQHLGEPLRPPEGIRPLHEFQQRLGP